MNDRLYAGMREASRLTRAGRLIDATALLRRVLQSGRDPDPAADNGATPPSIDLAPDTVEMAAADRGRPESVVQAQLPAADIPAPEGGRFLTKSFSNQTGSRAYKLYVPSQYRGQPLPLIVMLHGCTQSPDDLPPARG